MDESARPINLNVMIADDDEDDYYIFKTIIDDLSLNVSLMWAKNGEELFGLLSPHNVHVLFLDLLLPGKSGFECLAEIRGNSEFNKLVVVVLTAVDHPKIIESCYKQGADKFVHKDNTFTDLKNIMKAILKQPVVKRGLNFSFNDFILQN